MAPSAGVTVEKEKSATSDGVPTSESTNRSDAALRSASWELVTEPDRSRTSATSRPHCCSGAGFTRDCCQMPPDATRFVVPVPTMKSVWDVYVSPARSVLPVRNVYGVSWDEVPSPRPVRSCVFCV